MFNKYYNLGGAARDNTNQPKYQVVFWLSVLNAIIVMACVIEWSVTSPWAFFSWLLSPFFAFHHHLCSCGGSTLGSTRLHSRNVASAPWAASGLADPTPPKKRVKPGVSLPPCGPAWWVSRSQSKSVSGFQNWGHGHEGSWYTQSHGRAEKEISTRQSS